MKSTFFYILIRSWNDFSTIQRCFDSVLNQSYKNYQILFVDDCSGYSKEQKKIIRQRLAGHIVIFNRHKKYSVRNCYELIHKYAKQNEAVIVNLDGDDWLTTSNVLKYLNFVYLTKKCYLTYGSCYFYDGTRISLSTKKIDPQSVNIAYSAHQISTRSFREDIFLPLHLRTWKVWLFKKIKKIDFCDFYGDWLKFCEDQAIFFPLLEMAPTKCQVIKKKLAIYSYSTHKNIIDVHLPETIMEEIWLRRKTKYAKITK